MCFWDVLPLPSTTDVLSRTRTMDISNFRNGPEMDHPNYGQLLCIIHV